MNLKKSIETGNYDKYNYLSVKERIGGTHMATLKRIKHIPDRITSGHRMCAGCGERLW